jgi:hypothetical protein
MNSENWLEVIFWMCFYIFLVAGIGKIYLKYYD